MPNFLPLDGQAFRLPNTIPVPYAQDYDFENAAPLHEPSTEEKTELQNQIGSWIDKIDQTNLSPVQQERAVAISMLVTALLSASALVLAGLFTGIIPLAIGAAIGLVVLGLGLGGYTAYVFCKEDLDIPENRQLILENFRQKTFEQIASGEPTQEQIIASDLLELKLVDHTPEQKQAFYHHLGQLLDRHVQLHTDKTHALNVIQNIYEASTQPIVQLKTQVKNRFQQKLEEVDDENQLRAEYNRIKEACRQLTMPLNAWKSAEEERVNQAAKAALTLLSQAYDELLVDNAAPATPKERLIQTIENVKKLPVCDIDNDNGLWDDILSGMTQRFHQFPRLLLLDLLKTSTPIQCSQALCLQKYTIEQATAALNSSQASQVEKQKFTVVLEALTIYQKRPKGLMDLQTLLRRAELNAYLQSEEIQQTLSALRGYLSPEELKQKSDQLIEQIIEQLMAEKITQLKTKVKQLTPSQLRQMAESLAGDSHSGSDSNIALFRGISSLVYPIENNKPFLDLINDLVPMD
jgi:hypothetical protein